MALLICHTALISRCKILPQAYIEPNAMHSPALKWPKNIEIFSQFEACQLSGKDNKPASTCRCVAIEAHTYYCTYTI